MLDRLGVMSGWDIGMCEVHHGVHMMGSERQSVTF